MKYRDELVHFFWLSIVFVIIYFLPTDSSRFTGAVIESFKLLNGYAREHVLLCLIPAFFIAGIISVFISRGAILKYFGPAAKKWLSYLVASISGTVLAVCSCTILPLFAGIYKRGAGLGPVITFLYSGPGINIMAIFLTAYVLGFEMGTARVVGAVSFSIIIGLIMAVIFGKEERERHAKEEEIFGESNEYSVGKVALHFFVPVAIMVIVNWGKPPVDTGFWFYVYSYKWVLAGILGMFFYFSLYRVLNIGLVKILLSVIPVVISLLQFPDSPQIAFVLALLSLSVLLWNSPGKGEEWLMASWGFAKQILPLLAIGVLAAGFLLGSGGSEGILPGNWIAGLVGGNSLFANFFASVVGAFMYFATLTEIPILQGLLANGMGKGPALALLLAGPALSLPNMLVIKSVIGTKKTVVFIVLVIVMATITGMIYGYFF